MIRRFDKARSVSRILYRDFVQADRMGIQIQEILPGTSVMAGQSFTRIIRDLTYAWNHRLGEIVRWLRCTGCQL